MATVPAQNLARGITLILITTFLLAVQDTVFKLYAGELSLWQIFTLRGIMTMPLFFGLAVAQKKSWSVVAEALSKWPMIRGTFIALMLVGFYAAFPFLSLSVAGSAVYVTPIIVAILSGIFLKEPVRLFGWIGIFVGFAGVLILLRPGTDAFSPWLFLPLFGAFLYAIAHTITRVKCGHVSLWAMSFAINVAMMTVGIVGSLIMFVWKPNLAAEFPYVFGGWGPLALFDWSVLFLLACFTVMVGMMMAGAYQSAPPATIATFEYSYLIYAAIIDIVIFAVVPGVLAFVGMGLIILAGLFVSRNAAQNSQSA